ncbi:MAG: NAD(P)-dependent oxidoreductase [Pseudomonadota bacterium]
MSKDRIGIIGVGMMGGGMAQRLLAAGHAVRILVHRNRRGIDALVTLGATEAIDHADLVANCDVLLTCLPNAESVQAVFDAVRDNLRPGQLWIETTTSRPETTRAIASALAVQGVKFVDAPVTGGPPEAAEGRLASLIGCPEAEFDRVAHVTNTYSIRSSRFGEAGSGHAAKLLNNLVSQGAMILLADAFRSADELGLDQQALFNAMQAGAARSGTLEKAVGPALLGNFQGARFTIANAHKDLRYAQDMLANLDDDRAKRTASLAQRLDSLIAAGCGDRFVSEMLDPRLVAAAP